MGFTPKYVRTLSIWSGRDMDILVDCVDKCTMRLVGSCCSNVMMNYLHTTAHTFTSGHRWELPGNYPVFKVVMVIYHYVERIWRIIVTPVFL